MGREHTLIRRYFKPLGVGGADALGLSDDGALLRPEALGLSAAGEGGSRLVVACDSLQEGVHFLKSDAAGDVGRKLLRVNLSDFAAMGARARVAVLSLALPEPVDEGWLADFASGLGEDLRTFRVSLAGGDMVSCSGGVGLSMTLLGSVEEGGVCRRSGAVAGDSVVVSGTLGDAALGLRLAREGGGRGVDEAFLLERYRVPVPRVGLSEGLRRVCVVHGAIDISDGLMADVGHMARESGLGVEVELGRLPLSGAFTAVGGRRGMGERDLRLLAARGGDDYELAFAVVGALSEVRVGGVGLREVGCFTDGHREVRLMDGGERVDFGGGGYAHFSKGEA